MERHYLPSSHLHKIQEKTQNHWSSPYSWVIKAPHARVDVVWKEPRDAGNSSSVEN